jgi:hypothetical protein
LTLESIKECGVVSIGGLIGLSFTREAQQRYNKRAENKKKELELKNYATRRELKFLVSDPN